MERVNGAPLADAIDPADPLLQAHRIPGQLQIDHRSTRLVKVEPFARGIGGEEDGSAPAREGVEGCRAFLTRQTTVQHRHGACERFLEMSESVPIFRKDDGWFAGAVENSDECRDLRFVRRRRSCGRGKPAEQFAFARRITERNRSRPLRRRIGAIRLAVHIAERQRELMKLAVGRRAKGRKAAGDRLLQRMRAR